jgi:hypothetical protein
MGSAGQAFLHDVCSNQNESNGGNVRSHVAPAMSTEQLRTANLNIVNDN